MKILTSVGLVLVIFSLVWQFAIFPAMNKMPADHHKIVNFDGTYKVMNPDTQSLDEIPVKVKREQQATGVEDNVLIINQVITTSHADSGMELPLYGLTEVLGVERSKREYIPGYGDMERSGQFSLPGDLEEKSYFLWIPTAGRPLEARFTGEEDFHGLKVFTFEISEQDLDIGLQADTGMPQSLDISVKMKAEPVSGTTVRSESVNTIKILVDPSMVKLPADHQKTINFEGTYKVMNPETQSLDEIAVTVKQEQQATGVQDNVLIINQVITTSHADSGIELPLYGLTEVLGVERSKREYVPGYGDMDRSGQFCFPGDMEQKSYFLWIPTAERPLEARFTGEEDFNGLKVFTFEINEQDLDIGIYEAANMPQVLDISVKMKVEPLSGTTVYSESLTTIKVVATPDMKVAVYISDIKFTDDTIADLVDTARSARTALLTKWPVYISSLIFTDDTMTDLLDIAGSARTQLLWARVYGFWLCLSLGIVFTLVGVSGIILSRRREAA